MFNEIQSLCLRGNEALEDRVGGSEQWLFVIDGASGLTGSRVTSYDSDAAWLAENAKIKLENLLSNMQLTLRDILRIVAEELKAEYYTLWKLQSEEDVDYPSAGIAVLRINGNTVEYIGLGDCTILVEDCKGDIEAIYEEKLAQLDQSAIEKMAAIQKDTGCTMKEARVAINPLLIHNRNLRNKPEGYWIFDPVGEGVAHAREKKWHLQDIKSVALMSDGFAQLVQTFGIVTNFEQLHDNIKKFGLETLAKQLFKAQDDDPECINFPRFKLKDDTSVVYAEVKAEVKNI